MWSKCFPFGLPHFESMSKIIKKGKFFKYIRQAGSKIFLLPNYVKVVFQALQISNKKMKILPLFSFEKLKIYQITNHNHQKIDKGINFLRINLQNIQFSSSNTEETLLSLAFSSLSLGLNFLQLCWVYH